MLKSRQTLLAAGLGALTIFLLMAFRTLEQTGDSLTYATAIKTGERLFHPHHLLFSPLARLVFLALRGLGLPVDGILAGQIHNASWAAVAVVVLFYLTRRWTGSTLLATAAALVLLSCQGFLLFASQVEVYVPTLGCAALLLLTLDSGGDAPPTPARLAMTIALLSLLIFYHQSNVLFCLPLATFFIWREKKRGLRTSAIVIGLAGALVLTVYIGAYFVQVPDPSPSGFGRFCLRYALMEKWGAPDNVSSQGVLSAMAAQAEAITLIPHGARQGAAFLVGILVFAMAAWNITLAARHPPTEARRALLVTWLATYYPFFIWWQPGQNEFFIITLLPLLLLLVLMVNDLARLSGRPWMRPALAGVLLLAAGILTPRHVRGTLLPLHDGPGRAYAEAARLKALAPPGCTMFARRLVIHSLHYYFDVSPERTYNTQRVQRIFLWQRQKSEKILPARACVILPMAGLAPGGMAYETPVQWFKYLSWILRLEQRGENTGFTAPTMRLVQATAGTTYVLQPGTREPVANLSALCRRLDILFSQGTQRPFSGFQTWLKAVGPRLRQAGVDLQDFSPPDATPQSSSPPT